MPQHPSATILRVGIYYTEPEQKEKAQQLADHLCLPIISDRTEYDFVLSFINDRLCLSIPGNSSKRQSQVYTEFVKGAAGYRRKQGKKEMLLKAIGFPKNKPLTILDVTGGMGKDSFIMASHGCNVHIIERNPIVAALLEDGLRRAVAYPDTRDIAQRIQFSVQDSITFLSSIPNTSRTYDVIYLDPMFPERSKSALVKKEMQVLQKLIGVEFDTDNLFTAALAAATKRVVVKRPKSAPPLKGKKHTHSLSSKTIRFDVYLLSRKG